MSKNSEFTCDRCGAQFDGDEGFSFTLGRKEMERSFDMDCVGGFKYDLCESCAAHVMRGIVRFLSVNKRAGDAE